MIAPATAITGTSAFTPMSGSSATVRKMPVPKPPMPPTMAAQRAIAAMAARVGGSRSNLARHRARAPATVDGHVGERRLGDLYHPRVLRPALGVDLDRHRDGGVADAPDLHVEGQQVADLH